MLDAERLLQPHGSAKTAIEIVPVEKNRWEAFRKTLSSRERAWADAQAFGAETGKALICPTPDGGIARILYGGSADADPFMPGKLARALPPGRYRFAKGLTNPKLAALGWLLESYEFAIDPGASKLARTILECPSGVDRAGLIREANAVFMVRDLINRPANDLTPDALEAAVRKVAKAGRAALRIIKGAALKRDFPLIHTVGMASASPPRLTDFTWGNPRHPRVTLIGKGVCFDTGGLDIKPASGMALMKKDMGGAATVLGLAQMIMAAKLPVRLRVLTPIVENSIAGNSFRPGDVYRSRKGLTVEIGNTDAEGRLILADAMALADEEKPDLMLTLATLTGAARVALGPDLPPFYTDDDPLAAAIAKHATAENDPLWRMPLWRPYNRLFESPVADLNNSSESGFAGSITAALFLRRFVEKAASYVHFDIFAWTPSPRPGRPKGGEAQAMRALFGVIRERYAR
ncbi:MAG: leucyl aminopeptidase family protein [Aestuariivirga sp.]